MEKEETFVSSVPRDENAVFEEFAASGSDELQAELIRLLTSHASAVVWMKLHEKRPEIVNEAIFKALRNAKRFKGESKFSTWFERIVRNLCADALRQKLRLREDPLLEEILHPTSTGGEDIMAKILIARMLAGLNEQERLLLEMKRDNASESELAELFGLTKEGVRSRWFKLRKKLCSGVRIASGTSPSGDAPGSMFS